MTLRVFTPGMESRRGEGTSSAQTPPRCRTTPRNTVGASLAPTSNTFLPSEPEGGWKGTNRLQTLVTVEKTQVVKTLFKEPDQRKYRFFTSSFLWKKNPQQPNPTAQACK